MSLFRNKKAQSGTAIAPAGGSAEEEEVQQHRRAATEMLHATTEEAGDLHKTIVAANARREAISAEIVQVNDLAGVRTQHLTQLQASSQEAFAQKESATRMRDLAAKTTALAAAQREVENCSQVAQQAQEALITAQYEDVAACAAEAQHLAELQEEVSVRSRAIATAEARLSELESMQAKILSDWGQAERDFAEVRITEQLARIADVEAMQTRMRSELEQVSQDALQRLTRWPDHHASIRGDMREADMKCR